MYLLPLAPLLLGIVLASVPILVIVVVYFPLTLRLLASRKKQALYISTGLAVTVVLLLQSYRLQSEFNAYVRPRSVTDAQAEHLKKPPVLAFRHQHTMSLSRWTQTIKKLSNTLEN